LVLEEVKPAMKTLQNDVFGNYVIQKIFEHGTPEMRTEILTCLVDETLALSLQMYGCRVVQKALEVVEDSLLDSVLSEFRGNVVSCIHDQNGNHVIQKIVEVANRRGRAGRLDADATVKFILDDVLSQIISLSCHPYGCRVIQRILEHCSETQKVRALDEILLCHSALLDDQYGNYVIQHVLQYGRDCDRDSILGLIVEGGLLILSRQKFASNVVEKLLKFGNAAQRNMVVREMLRPAHEEDGSSVVLLMVRDAYANYVVQTTLDVVAEGEERRLLLQELNEHSGQLRNYTFAKHIVAKISE